MARRMFAIVLVSLAALAITGVASAREVVLRDDDGRTIRFDVQADADVQLYANVLLNAVDVDEIELVTFRIVSWR